MRGGEPRHRGIDRHGVADRLQFVARADRRAAAIGHVGHHRPVDARAGLAHLGLALQRLEEDDVGTGLGIGLAALHRALEAMRLPRIGAGDDQRLGALPRLDRDLDLLDHVDDRHDPLERRVAALLREFLVFDLDADDAGLLIAAHGVVHVEQAAIAGIGIGDDARLRDARQRRDAVEHLRIGRDAGVGQAIGRGGRPVAGGIDEIEVELVADRRRDHVVDAGGGDEFAGREGGAEAALGHVDCPILRR